jgi:hypothetical protein
VRIFKTKEFARFARRAGIADGALREAIDRAERGLIDADLGAGLIKQRIARIGTRATRWLSDDHRVSARRLRSVRDGFLVMGFAKGRLDNIDDDDLTRLKAFAGQVLSWSDAQVKQLLDSKEWQELT